MTGSPLEALYKAIREWADGAGCLVRARGTDDTEAQFHTGRQPAFLTVLHILEDDYAARVGYAWQDGRQS